MSTEMDVPTDSAGNEIGKIFVGGLSQNTTNDTLRQYFSKYGEVEDAAVMMDNRTNRSRGFGYIRYKDPNIVDLVLNSATPHVIDGKEVDPKQCNVNMKGKNRRSLKIFVGGIAPEHTEKLFATSSALSAIRRVQGPPGVGGGPVPTAPGRGRGRGAGGGGGMWNTPSQGWGQSWSNPATSTAGWPGATGGSSWGQTGWDQNGWNQWNGQTGAGWDQISNNWQQQQMAGAWGNQSGAWGGQPTAAATWDASGQQTGWGGPPTSMYGGSGDYNRGGGAGAHSFHPYKRQQ
uniref:RRM domain-containing protein n=1 Tax=Macrostomum lignano TaxID=282301 RepID=A0A1I8HD64_9PLAT